MTLPTEAWQGAEIRRRSAKNSYVDLPGPEKMSQSIVCNLVFNEDFKIGSAIYVSFVSKKLLGKETQKNTAFVRFSDYYLNISLWGHSFHYKEKTIPQFVYL